MSAVNKAADQGQAYPCPLNEIRWNEYQRVVNAFFDDFHPDDTRELLWNWLTAVLGAEHPLFQHAKSRADLLFFYERLEELIHAAYEWNSTTKRPPVQTNESIGENTV